MSGGAWVLTAEGRWDERKTRWRQAASISDVKWTYLRPAGPRLVGRWPQSAQWYTTPGFMFSARATWAIVSSSGPGGRGSMSSCTWRQAAREARQVCSSSGGKGVDQRV